MAIKILQKTFPFVLLALVACNLTQDVEIELPEYERQPVVECYLEPDQPFRLLLTQSYPFFGEFTLDSFLEKTLLNGAVVTISYDGRTDTLQNTFFLEGNPFKIYNYVGTNLVPATPGLRYTLDIVLPNGLNITGETVMLQPLPIDSSVVERSLDRDTLFRILTYITDDQTTDNYFRRLLNYGSLDSVPEQDFIFSDRTAQEPVIAFGTGYDLTEGDTAFSTVYHISRDYYDYVESVQLAIFGNVNPFAQPSPIKSNVRGSGNPLGIFTCLVYDRDMLIIGQ